MTVDEATLTVLKDMKPGKTETGLAFEYAMVVALQSGLTKKRGGDGGVVLEKSPRLERLKKAFEDIPASGGGRGAILECAKLADGALLRKFEDLRGPIRVLEDSAGIENEQGGGNVCDLQIGRDGGNFLGVSCKLNNDELKHNRMAGVSRLVRSSFDVKDIEGVILEEEEVVGGKILRRFSEVAEQEITWDSFKTSGNREGERLITTLMRLNQRAFRKVLSKAEGEGRVGVEARRLVEFILGPEDYVIVRADDGRNGRKQPKAELRFHNPKGGLGENIGKTTLPDRVVRIENDPNEESPAFRVIFGGQGGGRQLGFRMRLHSASGLVASSLKWSVKWVGGDQGGEEKQPNHCWEVEKATASDGSEIQADFLEATLGADEIALGLAGVVLSAVEDRRESCQSFCNTILLEQGSKDEVVQRWWNWARTQLLGRPPGSSWKFSAGGWERSSSHQKSW